MNPFSFFAKYAICTSCPSSILYSANSVDVFSLATYIFFRNTIYRYSCEAHSQMPTHF